jgi:hypothetical protein
MDKQLRMCTQLSLSQDQTTNYKQKILLTHKSIYNILSLKSPRYHEQSLLHLKPQTITIYT